MACVHRHVMGRLIVYMCVHVRVYVTDSLSPVRVRTSECDREYPPNICFFGDNTGHNIFTPTWTITHNSGILNVIMVYIAPVVLPTTMSL